MAKPRSAPWYATAAYLYVLHLDPLARAWEYLRRNPDYRRDWCGRRQPQVALRWGLRVLEDPNLDARDAQPAWCAGDEAMLQLHLDLDPAADAVMFDLWRLPGHKRLVVDGGSLLLTAQWPGQRVRAMLAPDLHDGMAYVAAARSRASERATTARRDALALAATPVVAAYPRPSAIALRELHTLQALDASLAGASLREVADVLFGPQAVARDWYADGALRAHVRRLVRRGRALMRGGYRRLAQLPMLEQGRSRASAHRP